MDIAVYEAEKWSQGEEEESFEMAGQNSKMRARSSTRACTSVNFEPRSFRDNHATPLGWSDFQFGRQNT